jgi:phosphoinositide-3-kinase regulatory subunit 4
MKQTFKFKCEPRYGIPQSLLVDPNRNWILNGTSRGIFQLFDIRFNIKLKTWAHPALSPINSLEMYSETGGNNVSGILAGIAGGFSEVGAWDIETGKCKKVWCSLNTRNSLVASSTESILDQELRKLYGNGINDTIGDIDV